MLLTCPLTPQCLSRAVIRPLTLSQLLNLVSQKGHHFTENTGKTQLRHVWDSFCSAGPQEGPQGPCRFPSRRVTTLQYLYVFSSSALGFPTSTQVTWTETSLFSPLFHAGTSARFIARISGLPHRASDNISPPKATPSQSSPKHPAEQGAERPGFIRFVRGVSDVAAALQQTQALPSHVCHPHAVLARCANCPTLPVQNGKQAELSVS